MDKYDYTTANQENENVTKSFVNIQDMPNAYFSENPNSKELRKQLIKNMIITF